MGVAANLGFSGKVYHTLRSHIVVASVGPIMTAALREHGIEPDIEPGCPKMAVLLRKRQPRS